MNNHVIQPFTLNPTGSLSNNKPSSTFESQSTLFPPTLQASQDTMAKESYYSTEPSAVTSSPLPHQTAASAITSMHNHVLFAHTHTHMHTHTHIHTHTHTCTHTHTHMHTQCSHCLLWVLVLSLEYIQTSKQHIYKLLTSTDIPEITFSDT